MTTYTQLIFHIIFSTKNRQAALSAEKREDLFRYIWGIAKNKQSHLYRINGVEDHVHILTDLHPSISLADFVKTVKISSSKWIKENRLFGKFAGWQDGYGAFTHSINDKDAIIEYIKNQVAHHKRISFQDELRNLLIAAHIDFDEKYLL
jgi:REP element-mobilizing transposase RayT